ncbi:MAG: DEAD/DEAH box helicase [Rhodomicrobium sp.]
MTQTTFDAFGLSEPILRALRTENFVTPTPIQGKAIPILLEGADLMAIAQTGTGKTAAFGLPLLERIAASGAPVPPKTVQALILVPTRELALQVNASLAGFARHLKLRHAIVIGGVKMSPQTRQLAHGVHVLVATAGRLMDHLREGNVKLDRVSMLVLDEADRMLDMGFINDVRKIASLLPKTRQSAMFSATMPPEIAKLANQILHNAERVQIAPSGTTAGRVTQNVIFVEKAGKLRLLQELLGDPAVSRAIVFTRTKRGADRVATQAAKAGVVAEALHGNKSQNARQRALARFSSGQARVLVATDIASRGIDVDQVSHVINFEMPDEAETYVHRIGRTARAGSEGVAVSFCDAGERGTLRAIEKLTGQPLIVLGSAAGSAEIAQEPRAANDQAQAKKAKPARRRPMKEATDGGAKPAPRARAQKRSTLPSGTVKWFNEAKGFGFVEQDGGGKDVFVHISETERAGLGIPREGQRVSFDLERDERGRLSARNLRTD